MSVVLDASAMLAFLHDEPGGEMVAQVLDGAYVSTINWSEVLQKSLQHQVDIESMEQAFSDLGVNITPFSSRQAETAARLWLHTHHRGLSLADRACLALAVDKALPVLTADRTWVELDIDLEIRLFR